MAITLHKDLTDANLHTPKGFATANVGTYPVKTSSNKLRWGGIERIQTGGYIRMTVDSHYHRAAAGNYYWTGQNVADDNATFSQMSPLAIIQAAEFIPHTSCYIKKVRLWARGVAGETFNVRLFKTDTALVHDSNTNLNVTKLGSDFAYDSDHSLKSYVQEQTFTATTGALVADQPIFLTCSGFDGTQNFVYLNGFIEIVYTG